LIRQHNKFSDTPMVFHGYFPSSYKSGRSSLPEPVKTGLSSLLGVGLDNDIGQPPDILELCDEECARVGLCKEVLLGSFVEIS
jgi:hypothetical protein